MDIALTSPYAHPHVRRGSERYLAELSGWLAGRGHGVTVVTTAPEPAVVTTEDGTEVRYLRPGRTLGRGRLHVDALLSTTPAIARGVRGLRIDIAQCHHYVDAIGLRAGRIGRAVPYVLWLPGAPRRSSVGGRPLHRAAFRLACGGARRIHALSRFAASSLEAEFGIASEHVPPGVLTDLYAGPKRPGADPVILCTAAPEDPRKRVALLVRAFPLVLRHRPSARLVLAPVRAEAGTKLLDLLDADPRARADVVAGLDFAGLAQLYRDAAVTVLPSVQEAFGLAIVESLAAGTSVVGTNHGAIPEILDVPGTGRLFEPDDVDDLARAIVEGLDLAGDAGTPDRCRGAACRWDWSTVGPRLEAAYLSVLG